MNQKEQPARRKGPKPFVIGMLIGVPVMALSVTAIAGSMIQSKYDRPMTDPIYDRPAYTAHAKAPEDVDFSRSDIAYGTADKMTVINIEDLGETPDGSTNGGRGYAVEEYAGVYTESGGAVSSPQEPQDIQDPPSPPSEWGSSLEDTGNGQTDPGDRWTIHEVEDSGGDAGFVPRDGNDISDQIWKDDHVTTYNSFTQREAVADSGGKLGKLSIPAIGLEANIYQSDLGEMEAMRHGIAHYNTTSSWDGNVGLCSHNWSPSGNGAYFQDLNKLKKGDTITRKAPEASDLEGLAFDKGSLEMEVGDVEDAPAHKIPADAPGDIAYTTGNPNVAAVDENGKVTAVGEGETTVTASCGDVKAEIPVTVTDPNKGGNDKEEDSELMIEYVFEDGSRAADTYKRNGAAGSSYSVESPSIGRRFVPSREIVEGEYTKAPTSVIITYKRIAALVETSASDGGTITETDDLVPLGENKTVEYAPAENFKVSSVKVDGKAVSVKEHPASYTFEDIQTDHTIDVAFEKDANAEKPDDGNKPGDGDNNKPGDGDDNQNSKPLTGVDFGKDKLDMKVGDTETVPAVKVPADADGKITYTTSDPSVATVDENGKITAVGEGVAIITAACGDKKDKIVVAVSAPSKDDQGGNNGNGVPNRTGSIVIHSTGVGVSQSKAFTYKVTFPDNADGEYEMSGDVRGKLRSGDTFVLYANESVTISGLPDGASCIVTQMGPGPAMLPAFPSMTAASPES